MMKFVRAVLGSAMLAAALALSPSASAQSVKVTNAWVPVPAPGQKTAGAYFDITSARDAALVAAGSPVADRVELHSMAMDGGVMRMRALPRIDLPAGQTVRLARGGAMHVMLVDLKQPLKAGDKVPLVLSIQPSGSALTTLQFEAEVRNPAAESHQH